MVGFVNAVLNWNGSHSKLRVETFSTNQIHRKVFVMEVSKAPGSIRNTIAQLKDGVQTCLSSRISRIEIQFPKDTSFGLEDANSGANLKIKVNDFELRSRELAKLTHEMFRGTGLNIAVVFNEEISKRAAIESWSKEEIPSMILAKELQKNAKSNDVLLCVNPKVKMLIQVQNVCRNEGDRVAVLLLNPDFCTVPWPNESLKQFFFDSFESAVYYSKIAIDSEPKSASILYRKFPDDWTLCQKRGLGAPVVVQSWKDRPTEVEVENAVLESLKTGTDQKNPLSGLINSMSSLFPRKQ
eukprot:CAMPEP_0182444582 /NCGR_PEP_ID=MMETSP1172-20130603/2988_1 /TAXON_ID=708627 /ORGANISM="Timspurckia oligopyrenoides, Strain CCMP3278" /LENGTH=296 /DNA_ID=CAMNT_0024640175 /DNA_START=122 /DNA_END=1012 /DNA_ORIENTATION=+